MNPLAEWLSGPQKRELANMMLKEPVRTRQLISYAATCELRDLGLVERRSAVDAWGYSHLCWVVCWHNIAK